MDNKNESVWYSGNWKAQNNSQEPYNGVKIIAKANYSAITSPPTSQKLVSVDIEVVDYTKDPNGVSSSISMSKTGVWYNIPVPDNDEVSPPEPNTNFTITSIDNNNLNELLQLVADTAGIYLNIQFRFGLNAYNEELGYIMKFDETYVDGKNPIQVS
ncbi:MAG: hypothetical protein JXR05_04950 [Flavobacteriaceae bacterium]